MLNINDIGTKLREIRKAKKITLQQLSDATNISIGSLSNIERNVSSPTLENMCKICEFLGTSVGDLLYHGNDQKVIVRKDEREILIDEENSIRCEGIDFGTDAATYMYMTMAPNSNFNGTWCKHEYDEVGTIISGNLTVCIEDRIYNLSEGDTIIIKANLSHCLYNTSDTECVSFWAKQWITG